MLRNKHFFLVEDDTTNRAVISVILREHGAHVPFDYWGDKTLQKMKAYYELAGLDLILLDLKLSPKVSGYDILAAIRATPELQTVPVVAVTASDPDIELPKARESGFNGYISKPINRYHFPRQLLAILEGQEVWEMA